jgi:hypothetical protein
VSLLRSGVLFFAPTATSDGRSRDRRKTQQAGGTPRPSYNCKLLTCKSSSIAYRPFSRPCPDCL